jgi:ubiquinone biosynthesis protein UbiJ
MQVVALMQQKSVVSGALTFSEAQQALHQLLHHAPEMLTEEQQVCTFSCPLPAFVSQVAIRRWFRSLHSFSAASGA